MLKGCAQLPSFIPQEHLVGDGHHHMAWMIELLKRGLNNEPGAGKKVTCG